MSLSMLFCMNILRCYNLLVYILDFVKLRQLKKRKYIILEEYRFCNTYSRNIKKIMLLLKPQIVKSYIHNISYYSSYNDSE